MINFLKNKRNEILFRRIYYLIEKKFNKIKIVNIGSGKNFFLEEKFKKQSSVTGKYILYNYDFFTNKEITKQRKNKINCYKINNKNIYKDSNVVIMNDILHHKYYAGLDYEKVGKFLVKLSKKTNYIFIKDHFSNTFWDSVCLKIMDFAGNKNMKINEIPVEYFNKKKFLKMLKNYNFKIKNLNTRNNYYPSFIPFFGNSNLHFSILIKKL